MTPEELRIEYVSRLKGILAPLASNIENQLKDHLKDTPRIDRITARAKDPDRFIMKSSKVNADGSAKYSKPFEQIQDLVGARIIVFYIQDVDLVSEAVQKYYKHIERRELIPESESEFGYIGKHFILSIPEDIFDDDADRSRSPTFFELQIKTLFQHAWSEAGHDIAYKPSADLSPIQKRMVAYTAAQAWGADHQFARLNSDLNNAPRID